jgi:predicted amidophosphoribosyltransferase
MCWFVIRFLWFVGESVVYAVKAALPKPEEHPVDWHGQPPPVCKACGYDLRGSPDRCSECGAELDPVDSAIVRYMISLGHTPVGQAAEKKPPEPGRPCVVFGRRRGELKYRPTRA